MPDFLSPAWMALIEAEAAEEPGTEVALSPGTQAVRVAQTVTGTPWGDARLVLELDGAGLHVEASDAPAHAEMVLSYATALGLAMGTTTLHDVVLAGCLKIRGSVEQLQRAAPVLAALHTAMVRVRASTRFPTQEGGAGVRTTA